MLKLDPGRERLTAKSVSAVLRAVVRDDSKKKLHVIHKSPVLGLEGQQVIQFTLCEKEPQDGSEPQEITIPEKGHDLRAYYLIAFTVINKEVGSCFVCITPSGKEYSMRDDGGNPGDHMNDEDRKLVSDFFSQHAPRRIVVAKKCWVITCDHGTQAESVVRPFFDKGPGRTGITYPHDLMSRDGMFYDEESANKAASRVQLYMDDIRGKDMTKKKGKK